MELLASYQQVVTTFSKLSASSHYFQQAISKLLASYQQVVESMAGSTSISKL